MTSGGCKRGERTALPSSLPGRVGVRGERGGKGERRRERYIQRGGRERERGREREGEGEGERRRERGIQREGGRERETEREKVIYISS